VAIKVPSIRRLKDKEVKSLLREVIGRYPLAAPLESARSFEEVAVGEDMIYFVDSAPLLIRTKLGLLPSLKFEKVTTSLPHVTVDMGAVAHMVNGADVMRPGIKAVESDFGKNALIVIIDEKYRKPIALGFSDVDSTEMRRLSKGKVIRNIHYVGDELWKSFSRTA
jgi:PUA domain protein